MHAEQGFPNWGTCTPSGKWYPSGMVRLSERVHLRLAREGKNMFIHYSFQIIYIYEFVRTISCY